MPRRAGKAAESSASFRARVWARVGEERDGASAADVEEFRREPVVDHATSRRGRSFSAPTPGPSLDAQSALGRHRRHRFPARPHALKVLYSDEEQAVILHAAEISGLRPSIYVGAAAVAMAEQVHSDRHPEQADEPEEIDRRRQTALTPHHDRELLAELVQARLALRRYAVNVTQIAAALNSSGAAPVWLERAVAGADRAVARLDAVALRLVRRLS